jgi:hypothetical protein
MDAFDPAAEKIILGVSAERHASERPDEDASRRPHTGVRHHRSVDEDVLPGHMLSRAHQSLNEQLVTGRDRSSGDEAAG